LRTSRRSFLADITVLNVANYLARLGPYRFTLRKSAATFAYVEQIPANVIAEFREANVLQNTYQYSNSLQNLSLPHSLFQNTWSTTRETSGSLCYVAMLLALLSSAFGFKKSATTYVY